MFDTENKRRSILGLKPVANLVLDSLDRIQFMDWFAAILPRIESFFFWRKHHMNQTGWEKENVSADPFSKGKDAGSTNWRQDGDSANPFITEKHSSDDWVPVLDFPEVQ
jgi:hypothetical protein